jgi:uncharacterized protein (DUF1501 family)
MKLNRRNFLKGSCATAVSYASLGTLVQGLTSFNAHAADDDYKALVCVFLLGGMDNHDLVLPYDTDSYAKFATIRNTLLQQHGANRQRENLLALDPQNSADFGSRQFALPPEMSNIKQLFDAGNAAIIGNVGPLVQPTSKSQFEAESVALPPRLFSHNDQQSVWMSSQPEGAQTGWGGLFADSTISSNVISPFAAVTSAGNELFLTGAQARPYQISPWGSAQINVINELDRWWKEAPTAERLLANLQTHFASETNSGVQLLQQDITNMSHQAYLANQQYSQSFANAPTLATEFPEGYLAAQLQVVARTIAIHQQLQVNRQVFMVAIGGFDTHSEQADDLPELQSNLDNSISAFYQAMVELELHNQVTTFTASDFGRTLAVNGDGTDHGWGAHHLVMGGAVNGNRIYGDLPPAELGHSQDAGGGRLIPSLSVEQYAAPMGRWFGLSDSQLAQALPNLGNFEGQQLSFL